MANIANSQSHIAASIATIRSGNETVEGGIAALAEGLIECWSTPFSWSYGKGDDEVRGVTSVAEMMMDRRKPDGSKDTKYRAAVWFGFGEAFGVDGEITGADQVAIRRGFAIAAAYMSGKVPVQFVTVEAKHGKTKGAKVRAVQVPAAHAYDLTKEDGSLTDTGSALVEGLKSNASIFSGKVLDDAEALAAASAFPVVCVGGKHPVLGKVPSATSIAKVMEKVAVESGYMPQPKPRNRDKALSAESFVASCDYIVRCLDEIMGAGDEADVAMSDALEEKLRATAERIAAYFAA